MRKILLCFLSLVMVFAPAVAANAATSVGGWTAVDTITAGATNTINAVKGAGSSAVRSAVTVGASAAKVGKHLIKGGGQAALAYAMVELLDEGIDWVLDPANNSIRYTPSASDPSAGDNSNRYTYNGYATPELACIGAISASANRNWSYVKVKPYPDSPNTYICVASLGGEVSDFSSFSGVLNPHYVEGGSPVGDRYIPIETVAAKVISNAEAGHAPSQEAVKATALEGFAAGEHDAALDAAAVPDTGVENPPDTTDPENPPAPDTPLPFDPSSIIAAINALKALLAGILSSITGLSDFFQDSPPDKSQSETDVPVEVPPDVKNASEFDVGYVSFGGQCPAMSPFSINILGSSSSMTFDMTPLCNLAVTIRPAIIAIAYFIGLGVIASAIRET